MATATTQFRWLVRENKVTAEQVRTYVLEHFVPMDVAKRTLTNRKPPVLQQWFEAEGWEHADYVAAGGYWEDVPIVTEPSD